MSSQFEGRIGLLMTTVLVAGVCACAQPQPPSETTGAVMAPAASAKPAPEVIRVTVPQGTAVAPSAARNAAIVATTITILKETSEIRELAILRPVKSGAQSRTEIERMIIRNLDEQTTPAEMHATEVSLKKLGLAPDVARLSD